MVDESLLNYIKRQLAKGHSVQEVSSFLVTKGYSKPSIDECVQAVYSQPIEDKKRSVLPIIALIVIILAIIASVFYFTLLINAPIEAELSLSIDFDTSTFSENSQIKFKREIASTGDMQQIPARILYQVKDNKDVIVYSSEENIAVSGSSSKDMVMDIPKIKPGSYSLHVTLVYQGKSQVKTSSFIVEGNISQPKKPTCFDNVKNQGEDGIDCGGPCKACIRQCPIFYDDHDSCTTDKCGQDTNFIPVHEPIVPCCGNKICESSETNESCQKDCLNPSDRTYFNDSIRPSYDFIADDTPLDEKIEQIREMSATDMSGALDMCAGIVFTYYQDKCFEGVAEETKRPETCEQIREERSQDACYTKLSKVMEDSSLCSNIQSSLRRDSCYMRFALKGDYSVCDKLEDDYYVQSCNQLEQIHREAPEAVEEYYNKID